MDTEQILARNLSFRHLRAFVCVARTGSFTKAANLLATSQPALTANIRQFEDIVGVPLLERTTRTVLLTYAGEILLGQVETLLSNFENAVVEARASANAQNNRVNVVALPSVVVRLLPTVIAAMSQISPQTVVQLYDDNGYGVQAEVLNGKADFGIANLWEPHPDLIYHPLLYDRVGLVCHADHPLAKLGSEVSWAEIDQHPFVGMAGNTAICKMIQRFEHVPNSIQFPEQQVLTIVALVGLLEDSHHVTVLPALAAPDYLNPSLVFRDIKGANLHRELCLITSRKKALSEQARVFYHLIESHRRSMCGRFPNNILKPRI